LNRESETHWTRHQVDAEKRLLADAMLDNAALKELLGKKW